MKLKKKGEIQYLLQILQEQNTKLGPMSQQNKSILFLRKASLGEIYMQSRTHCSYPWNRALMLQLVVLNITELNISLLISKIFVIYTHFHTVQFWKQFSYNEK